MKKFFLSGQRLRSLCNFCRDQGFGEFPQQAKIVNFVQVYIACHFTFPQAEKGWQVARLLDNKAMVSARIDCCQKCLIYYLGVRHNCLRIFCYFCNLLYYFTGYIVRARKMLNVIGRYLCQMMNCLNCI